MTQYNHWFLRARLKTRQLLLLTALAEEGNIHRASQVLNMTQPAASKLLKDLEDVLGVSLFERLPRGMRPTWYGETMIRHARAALSSLNQAHEELQAAKKGQFGQVRVGAITAPGLTLLPVTVARVKQAHPNIQVTVQIDPSNVLVEALNRGHLDMVVGRLTPQDDKEQLRYDVVSDEPTCAVARPGHPILQLERPTVADLFSYSWIKPSAGSVLRHRLELMVQELGLVLPSSTVESSSLLFVTKMLQQSDMVTVLAMDVARYYADHGLVTILPVVLPCEMDPFGIILRSDRLLSPAAQVFLDALKASVSLVYGRDIAV